MNEIPNGIEQRLPEDIAQNDGVRAAKVARRSQLPHILGIGGGAISGVVVAITFFETFPLGVFLVLFFGAFIGGLLRQVGMFAGLGVIVGIVVLSVIQPDHEQRAFTVLRTSVAAGSFVGVVWTIPRLCRRAKLLPAETSEARGDRLQLGRLSLVLGPLLGVTFGVLIGGAYLPILVGSILFGVIIGVALFFALTLSAFR
ncbi:MAG: hypothetical protein ACLQNE_38445 [Thermoguttaceae bacterium]